MLLFLVLHSNVIFLLPQSSCHLPTTPASHALARSVTSSSLETLLRPPPPILMSPRLPAYLPVHLPRLLTSNHLPSGLHSSPPTTRIRNFYNELSKLVPVSASAFGSLVYLEQKRNRDTEYLHSRYACNAYYGMFSPLHICICV